MTPEQTSTWLAHRRMIVPVSNGADRATDYHRGAVAVWPR